MSTIPSNTMRAWQVNSFGTDLAAHLQLNTEAPLPELRKPYELLIKIRATSINPIDVYMVRGYGAEVIQILRERAKGRGMLSVLFNRGKKFPLTLGRDIAGIVEQVGDDVTEFKVGDHVFGFVDTAVAGSHAEYAIVHKDWVQLKPQFLTFNEAAGIPFVSLTTWSVLRDAGIIDFTNQNFLVLGGSGGVGTIAIQYIKSKGGKVTTTCGSSSFPLLTELGADLVIDYKSEDAENQVLSHGPYDCIFDLAGGLKKSGNFMQYGRQGHSVFITLNFDGIHNLDNYGLIFGGLKTGWDLASVSVSSKIRHGVSFKWGIFQPNPIGFKEIAELVHQQKIKPIVDHIYKFSEVPQAYERVNEGHLRGKIIVEVVADQ